MAETTGISWADATFNPWIGCTKVSPACDHCYAERWGARMGVEWGPHAARRRTSRSNWNQPRRWNREAEAEGRRRRVFCASLADVFDNAVDPAWRCDLWDLIAETPHLDWLLLTKRPQNIAKMLPVKAKGALAAWGDGWPNVWLGTTVENQAEAERRIPALLKVPARLRFLSCEPLLGPLDLRAVRVAGGGEDGPEVTVDVLTGYHTTTLAAQTASGDARELLPRLPRLPPVTGSIGWVIAGGESGPNARPSRLEWFRGLRDQCSQAFVPFHFKQWGEFLPGEEVRGGEGDLQYLAFPDGHENGLFGDGWDIVYGTCMDHRGEPKRVWRDIWASGDGVMLRRVGVKQSGATLDGRLHQDMPA